MANVLQLDCTAGDGDVERDLGPGITDIWVQVDVAFNSTFLADLISGASFSFLVGSFQENFSGGTQNLQIEEDSGAAVWTGNNFNAGSLFTPATPIVAMQFYELKMHLTAGSPISADIWIDGVSVGSVITVGTNMTNFGALDLEALGLNSTGGFVYFGNLKVGTTEGGTDIYTDDFTDLSGWNNFVSSSASVITDPGIAPAVPGGGGGVTNSRVGIAFDDGPLAADPTWTFIDALYANLVAKIEISVGRQTLNARTDTGTATVYLNDLAGLFDPRNVSSPYFGKLDGKQILLQLQNPVTGVWESQFRGLIDDYGYVIDPASDKDGNPIVANIQIDCVDLFDYLAGYGLTPGLDGVVPPPAGSEGTVWYAETTPSNIDNRVIEVLTDANVDTSRYVVFGLNVSGQAANYNADDDALQVIRDCVDAEFPFIGNAYCDRLGRFCVHGRESRFDPDTVAASAGTAIWDFQRWKVGDGAAVAADSDRAQIRILGYSRARSNIINAAFAYPKNLPEVDMPNQVYADSTSITDYGKHAAPPMNDLVIKDGTTTGNSGAVECQKYAELLVKNQKDPREAITALQLKSVNPSDLRATTVWKMLTRADISDVVNVKAGYPGGTGFIGMATADDYYIEGRNMTIEPATGSYDYVELNLEVSPAVWSMDTHGVFA